MIGGIDLVDGTPILDIKPYVPFCDSIASAKAPDWVGKEAVGKDEPLKIIRVDVAERAEAPLASSYARSAAAKTLGHAARHAERCPWSAVRLQESYFGIGSA